MLPSSSLGIDPEEPPIKKEDDSVFDIPASPTPTSKSETKSPSLHPDLFDLESSTIEQKPDLTKTAATPAKPPAKRASTSSANARRDYLPEEIPPEYRDKPQHSYSHLIATALRAHPEVSGISLSEIYKSIQDIFPFYKYCPHGWQNSVRHNLSSNKAFRKISKEGKGWLWGIDEEYFQERERLKKKAAANSLKAKTAAAATTTPTPTQKTQPAKPEKDVQSPYDQQQYQALYTNPAQYRLHDQQFQAQLQQHAGHNPLSLPDASSFIPRFQPPEGTPRPELPEEVRQPDLLQTKAASTSPVLSSALPLKKERAKTIAELASEIQIDSRGDRLYYSNMTRESYAERKRTGSASDTATPETAPAPPTGKSQSQSPPLPMPPAVATNSIAQNDAILNSPRYQQYYNGAAGLKMTPALPARDSSPVVPTTSSASAPPSSAATPTPSMAAGQTTFRMTQAPKKTAGESSGTTSQSQLHKQTSVPQMRVNPQVPQGARGNSASASSTDRTKFSAAPAPDVSVTKTVPSTPAPAKPSTTTSGSGTNALASLNLPKETMRVLTLLQDKIKTQMQNSGQQVNSAVLTNALAIAISQLTKGSGGPAALSNLLKGKNQAQLVNALAAAISSAKKPGAAKQTTPAATPAPAPAKASPSPAPAPLPKVHPPVNVPAAISSPASLTSGTLPAHLSSIANFGMPQGEWSPPPASATASAPASVSPPPPPAAPKQPSPTEPVKVAAVANAAAAPVPAPTTTPVKPEPIAPAKASSTEPAEVPKPAVPAPASSSPTPAPAPAKAPTPAPAPAPAPAAPAAAAVAPAPAPAPTSTKPKPKAEMIADMLAKAAKLTNPSPSIRAALVQLQAHATKLGLEIPENLKKLTAEAAAEGGAKRAADESKEGHRDKIQKTD